MSLPASADAVRRALVRQGLRSFEVRSSKIRVLDSPAAFYDTLLDRCGKASKRVSLSALYWGTGARERALAAAVASAVSDNGAAATVVLDSARAKREDERGQTSLDALAPVAVAGGEVALVAPPRSSPPGAAILPRAARNIVNEILGVFHAKVFAVDDVVILSSANISDEYFVSRRDRYVVVEDAGLAAWHHDLVRLLADAPTFAEPRAFAAALGRSCARPPPRPAPARRRGPYPARKKRPRTLLFPALQLGSAGLTGENDAFDGFLRAGVGSRSSLALATAYLNPPRDVLDALAASAAPTTILFPSIETHGFGSATGVRRAIPAGHALFGREAAAALPRAAVAEWRGPGTFHGKGAWAFSRRARVAATVVGSSNWNARSRSRDLELGVFFVTPDDALQRAFAAEWAGLAADAAPRDDARVPRWARLLRPILAPFL
jgi:CDP-diacylglycerol--glycerol-3-phosphate 3-phosphatidyltransferase